MPRADAVAKTRTALRRADRVLCGPFPQIHLASMSRFGTPTTFNECGPAEEPVKTSGKAATGDPRGRALGWRLPCRALRRGDDGDQDGRPANRGDRRGNQDTTHEPSALHHANLLRSSPMNLKCTKGTNVPWPLRHAPSASNCCYRGDRRPSAKPMAPASRSAANVGQPLTAIIRSASASIERRTCAQPAAPSNARP